MKFRNAFPLLFGFEDGFMKRPRLAYKSDGSIPAWPTYSVRYSEDGQRMATATLWDRRWQSPQHSPTALTQRAGRVPGPGKGAKLLFHWRQCGARG